jgi:hypothetical protein
VTEFKEGGFDYEFEVGGETVHMPVPPDGFRPENASSEALARYAFPPRPEDSVELAAWTADMKTYRQTPIPSLCALPDKGP